MKAAQMQDEADAMAAWTRERAELLATIQRQQEDAERLTKRFKLLQRTLVDQQELLDRYQQALVQSGALPQVDDSGNASNKVNTAATGDAAQVSSDCNATTRAAVAPKAAIKAKPQMPTVDKHRALAAVNTIKNATSSIVRTTPVVPRVVTQNTKELAVATNVGAVSTSTSSSKSRQQDTDVTPRESKDQAAYTARSSSRAKPTASEVAPSSASVSKDEASASWISRKADFHRAPPVAIQSKVKPEPPSSLILPASKTTPTAPAHQSAAFAGVKRKAKSSSNRAPTWAQEKQRMKEAGIIVTTGKRRIADLKSSAAETRRSVKGDTSSQSGDEKEDAFQYVEVVRSREARAALPGHDCVECCKYYEALDGLIPDADAQLVKAKCSRHRAKFEPYNTPDDFWRLSFPDSEPQPSSP